MSVPPVIPRKPASNAASDEATSGTLSTSSRLNPCAKEFVSDSSHLSSTDSADTRELNSDPPSPDPALSPLCLLCCGRKDERPLPIDWYKQRCPRCQGRGFIHQMGGPGSEFDVPCWLTNGVRCSSGILYVAKEWCKSPAHAAYWATARMLQPCEEALTLGAITQRMWDPVSERAPLDGEHVKEMLRYLPAWVVNQICAEDPRPYRQVVEAWRMGQEASYNDPVKWPVNYMLPQGSMHSQQPQYHHVREEYHQPKGPFADE